MDENISLEDKIKIIENIEINNINRECLIKIIKTWEYLNNNNIVKDIKNKIDNESNEYRLRIIEIRLESIIEEFKKKNYLEKTENKDFILYKYEEYEVMYIKNLNIEKIIKKIEKMEYNFLKLYNEKKIIKKIKKNNIKENDLYEIDKIINLE